MYLIVWCNKFRSMRKRRSKENNLEMLLISLLVFLVFWSISAIVYYSIWISLSLDQDNKELTLELPSGPETFQRQMKNLPLCTVIKSSDISFTLAMQLSEDRLWMMKHHCERWGDHPISIAVHTKRTITEVNNILLGMRCSLQNVFVNVLYQNGDYPINRLRNLAISSVQTTHFMYVDVDFWPSRGVYTSLSKTYCRDALAKDHKLAIVVPAFQIDRKGRGCHDDLDTRQCDESNVVRMAGDRSSLFKLILSGDAHMFDPTNPRGHDSTGYRQWISTTQEHSGFQNVRCVRSNRYEPYVVLRRCELPPFQESFTGYGKNKLTWSMQIRRSGYIFKVIADEFLLHFPHHNSEARVMWNERPDELHYDINPRDLTGVNWKEYKRGRVDALYLEFKVWLMKHTKNQSRVPLCFDSRDDESKLWVDNQVKE